MSDLEGVGQQLPPALPQEARGPGTGGPVGVWSPGIVLGCRRPYTTQTCPMQILEGMTSSPSQVLIPRVVAQGLSRESVSWGMAEVPCWGHRGCPTCLPSAWGTKAWGALSHPPNGLSVSFCRCGEPGPQIHPAGSLQPVHQIQAPGVTGAAQQRPRRGRCFGRCPGLLAKPAVVPHPHPTFFWLIPLTSFPCNSAAGGLF